jgi:tRNA(Ile)-lysidine synthase
VHKLAQSVVAYIRKHDLLRPGDRVGIAVSGGADSVALLRLVLELRDDLGIVLSVVHLNHKLRGMDSDADEQFVRGLAGTYELEIIAESRDVKTFASERKLSVEAAAREARYEFFRSLLLSQVNRVATAHTLDDQAETVLLKLIRGAGTRGLAGIYPKKAISKDAISHQPSAVSRQPSAVSKGNPDPDLTPDAKDSTIIRPLLASRRSEVRAYLAEIGQTWREDASNQDLRHTRNRIRQEILPLLERQVNPAVCETLAESAEIARAEEAYWVKEVDRFLPEVWSAGECGGTLKLSPQSLPLALRRRLLRAAAESLGIALEFRHVEEIIGDSGEGSSVLPGPWAISRHGEDITFRQSSQSFSGYQYELRVPGKVSVAEAGIVVETSVPDGSDQSHKDDDLVGSRFAQHKWIVRNWRPGERFWPAHTKEPKKIKELLQDRHITGVEKQRWPVIACGDEIIWLSGFGVRRDFRAKGGQGVLIREIQGTDK